MPQHKHKDVKEERKGTYLVALINREGVVLDSWEICDGEYGKTDNPDQLDISRPMARIELAESLQRRIYQKETQK